MTSAELRNRFRGVFGFPITPFRQDLSLDLDGLARNVDQMSRHPFCALVAAGGTRGLFSLTVPEIIDVVAVPGVSAAGPMPVVAGAGLKRAPGGEMGAGGGNACADCLPD